LAVASIKSLGGGIQKVADEGEGAAKGGGEGRERRGENGGREGNGMRGVRPWLSRALRVSGEESRKWWTRERAPLEWVGGKGGEGGGKEERKGKGEGEIMSMSQTMRWSISQTIRWLVGHRVRGGREEGREGGREGCLPGGGLMY